ncbi:FKBP-type peptidylprolyl isomerase [Nitzschia inconspicua]|uniref:peptidylprolyl isomerase n=1 Tax=Nitzschia inconspicua TaxID=303405 RepID=A0A9K3M6G2_9STRA|nr:FKBP-type peptidylprolyl isomerase [Nitzschia inconspicua]
MKFTMKAFAALAIVGTATAFSLSMLPGASTSDGYNSLAVTPQKIDVLDRRTFLSTTTTAASSAIVAGGIVTSNPHIAMADDDADNDSNNGFTVTESGLQYKVLQEGTGAIPSPGQTVKAHYTGWLNGFGSDKKFDSSRDRGRPFTFAVGKGQVIRGWDEAFSTMKVGERRQLILPARLAYGDRGAGGIIPGGATLYFDVELLGIL